MRATGEELLKCSQTSNMCKSSRFSIVSRPGAVRVRAGAARSPLAAPAKNEILRCLVALLMFLFVGTAGTQQAADSQSRQPAAVTEAALRQMLVGHFLYLRGGYLDNSLAFDESGKLIGNSPSGSYTLSVIHVDSLSLTRHKLELRGARYGLHFLGAAPTADAAGAVDRVRITPRKKSVRITIARLKVVKPPKPHKHSADQPPAASDAAHSTTSPAYADQVLMRALDGVLTSSLDRRMMASMPPFWQIYYAGADAGSGTAPDVLPASQADRKPGLLTRLDAPSNQYAQDCGIAGVALYRAVVGADGTPGDVTLFRPIGFGLDESAVTAIRNARFEPALKDGKPVPVLLDLVVEFRIYSKRTSVAAPPADSTVAVAPRPGPYSVGAK
jgi:TonB family protein